MFRTGIVYEFEADELIVALQAIVDFVADEKLVVFGVTGGAGFRAWLAGWANRSQVSNVCALFIRLSFRVEPWSLRR